MKRLTFYNHYGIGDLFESREFVLEWMRVMGVSECEYACRFPAVFEDLPQIRCIELTPEMDMRKSTFRKKHDLFVNAWIGALNADTIPRGDYVLWPGVGCTVEGLKRMHSDYMRRIGLPRLRKPAQEFLTTVDYTKINTGHVREFAEQHFGKRMVLVANGKTGSGHANNFNMASMVSLLPITDDVIYILTERDDWNEPNVFFSDDITERNGRCDVMAISYLSTFCDMIVGRCSGAQMVCETKANWMDPNKTLVSFTHHRNGACFVFDPPKLGLKMRLIHSQVGSPEAAAEVLMGVLS